MCAERDWVGLKDCSAAGGRVEACQLLACVSRRESRDSKDEWLEGYEAMYMQTVHGKTRRKREVWRLSRPCESLGRACVAACLWTWLGRLDQQPGDSRLVPVRRSITPVLIMPQPSPPPAALGGLSPGRDSCVAGHAGRHRRVVVVVQLAGLVLTRPSVR